MPPSRPSLPPAAIPRQQPYDPWNSSSTGHQRAENRLSGSTAWRDSRTTKLASQFEGSTGGGRRIADTVGAGSTEFGQDGRKPNGGWEKGAPGLRKLQGDRSIVEMFKQHGGQSSGPKGKVEMIHGCLAEGNENVAPTLGRQDIGGNDTNAFRPNEVRGIFDTLNFYINGSTAPLVSDHKLKHLLVAHGGCLSISLGRRTVTHVILGKTGSYVNGSGGGLAGGKIQREIERRGGRGAGIRFVSSDWVLESIRAGRRLPETRYEVLRLTSTRQKSVYGMFEKVTKGETAMRSMDSMERGPGKRGGRESEITRSVFPDVDAFARKLDSLGDAGG